MGCSCGGGGVLVGGFRPRYGDEYNYAIDPSGMDEDGDDDDPSALPPAPAPFDIDQVRPVEPAPPKRRRLKPERRSRTKPSLNRPALLHGGCGGPHCDSVASDVSPIVPPIRPRVQCWDDNHPNAARCHTHGGAPPPKNTHEMCHLKGYHDTTYDKDQRMELQSRRIRDREAELRHRHKIASIGGLAIPQFRAI